MGLGIATGTDRKARLGNQPRRAFRLAIPVLMPTGIPGGSPPVPGVEYVGRTEYFSGSPTPPHALLRPTIHSNNEDHPGRRRLSDHAPDDHGRAAGARGRGV